MTIKDALYTLLKSRKQLVKFVDVTSPQSSFTKDTAKSTDISVADQEGYTFLTWLNPRGLAITGSFYITIFRQSQCRIWAVPASSNSNGAVAATAVFIKNEYA